MAKIDNHAQYDKTIDFVQSVRDSVVGEPALKSQDKRKKYLPPPCDIVDVDDQKKYNKYVALAEYDNVPAETLSVMIGAIFRKDPKLEVPDSILENADGDGLNLIEHMQLTAKELALVEYCGLLTEYPQINTDGSQLTIQQVRDLGLNASIKHYPRETICNWWFTRRGGVKRLTGVLLKQEETILNDDYESETKEQYLLLGIDEQGFYYQQLMDDEHEPIGERLYPLMNGQRMSRIPFVFAMAKEYPKGVVPESLGFIYPIVSKSLHRYQISADMKLAMYHNSVPTLKSSGWTQGKFDLYKEMTGNEQLRLGVGHHMPLPDECDVDFLSWNPETSGYFKYLEQNSAQLRALGGSFDDNDSADQLATVRVINQAEKNGRLSLIVSNLEQAYTKAIEWAMGFNGVEQDIEILFDRDFSVHKLTPQERQQIINEYSQGLITRLEALRQLEKGGVLTVTADELLLEADTSGE